MVTMVLYALALVKIARTEWKTIAFSTIILGSLWYLSGEQHPHLLPYLNENMQSFFVECLPYMWIFSYYSKKMANDGDSFFNLLLKIYKFRLVLALFSQAIMFVFPHTDIFHDYMSAANALLVGLVFVSVDNLRNGHKNRWSTILEVTAVIFILMLGSRGGIMCYASTYLLYFAFCTHGKNKIRWISLGAALLLVGYFMLPFILENFGGSRYITLLNNGELVHDEHRSLISDIMILNIVQNPWGCGIMADRDILISSTEIWEVFYAHNFFLEMGIDFGYIGILAAILYVVYIIITMRTKNINYVLIAIPLVATSIIKLMVSSSFWRDPIFWALAGIILTSQVYKKGVEIK